MLRTCIGCHAADVAAQMVRVTLADQGGLVARLDGFAPGRGAWFHARPECLGRAAPALSRALRARVPARASELAALVRAAACAAAEARLEAARRAGQLRPIAGAEDSGASAELVVAATDADSPPPAWLVALAARGRALSFSTRARLGADWVAVTDAAQARELGRSIGLTTLADPKAARERARPSVSSEVG